MVTDSATATMESLWETTIALSNGTIADPLGPPLLQMGVPDVTDFFCIRDMSPFGKLLWPFVNIIHSFT